jgi:4-carboxymuconolactone decarboxylase
MDKERYDRGQKLRREVLGDRYVDAAAKSTTDFNRPFQEFITENVWGNIWSRPGLDRRTRALINIGMLTAMGRTEEVRIYLRAAPNIGVTREDVREVLMQTAAYAGVPAAVSALNAAADILGT